MVVAVLGTGTMGGVMARQLLAAGIEVRAWNRTRARAAAVSGATVCDSPAEAASGADFVLTMLADGEAVAAAVEGVDLACPWLQMSTVGIADTERFAASAGVAFVDAPVLGTKQPAEKGELVVLASGDRAAREAAAPVFDAVGSKVIELGGAGEGTRLKLVLNNWLVALVAGLAETVGFAEAVGVDPSLFLSIIDGAPMGTPYAQLKGKMMVDRSFPPAFSLELARKDARLVLETASDVGFDAAVARVVASKMDEAIAAGHGDEDMAATVYASLADR